MRYERCWYSDVQNVYSVDKRIPCHANTAGRIIECIGGAGAWVVVRVLYPLISLATGIEQHRYRRRNLRLPVDHSEIRRHQGTLARPYPDESSEGDLVGHGGSSYR